MLELKQLELHDETSEIEVPYLPWLEEAQLKIYLETKDLTPEETQEYWAKKRPSTSSGTVPLGKKQAKFTRVVSSHWRMPRHYDNICRLANVHKATHLRRDPFFGSSGICSLLGRPQGYAPTLRQAQGTAFSGFAVLGVYQRGNLLQLPRFGAGQRFFACSE